MPNHRSLSIISKEKSIGVFTLIMIFLSFFLPINTSAQEVVFSEAIMVTNETIRPRSVFSADIDGDGDFDILSASLMDDKIAWYENINGLGVFGEQRIITTEAEGATSVYSADLDLDGDYDVVSASINDDIVAWYENTDGLGNFGPRQLILFTQSASYTVFCDDFDNDGYIELVSAGTNSINYYEDYRELPAFPLWDFIEEPYLPVNYEALFTSDIDGDGYKDILSARGFGNAGRISWFENSYPNGTIGTESTISFDVNYPMSVFGTDLDNDDDIDVVSASAHDAKIAWYENTDGSGNFGPQQIISEWPVMQNLSSVSISTLTVIRIFLLHQPVTRLCGLRI